MSNGHGNQVFSKHPESWRLSAVHETKYIRNIATRTWFLYLYIFVILYHRWLRKIKWFLQIILSYIISFTIFCRLIIFFNLLRLDIINSNLIILNNHKRIKWALILHDLLKGRVILLAFNSLIFVIAFNVF